MDLHFSGKGADIVTSPTVPVVECERMHVTLPVSDLKTAIDFYVTKLGFKLGFLWGEPAFFAGITLGKVEIFLKEDTPAPNAGAVVFMVNDADALYEFHRANGLEVIEEIDDREYGISRLCGERSVWVSVGVRATQL